MSIFPPTGIYDRISQMCHTPRSFALLRMTVGGGKDDFYLIFPFNPLLCHFVFH